MTCQNCGERPEPGDTFCGACGYLLETITPPVALQQPIAPVAAQLREPEPAPETVQEPAPEAVAQPEPDDWDEELDDTILAFRRQHDVRWRLELASGEPVLVITSTLLGRRPSAHPRWPRAQICRVSDPTRTMSKSHAVFEAVDDELWVSDLGSKNGVTVVHTDGSTEIVEPTGRTRVETGAVVSLGDYGIRVGRTQP